jgi:hypothetical protein
MLDGARWSRPAILRSEAPSARPREISSRSVIVSTRAERRRTAGTYPPLEATTPWIEPGCLPSARPISLSDSPAFQRDHSSRFCSGLNPGRPRCAIRPPPGRDPTIIGVASTDRTQGRGLQDLIRAAQLAVLPLQRLQPLAFVAGQPWPQPVIGLGSTDPLAQRLRRHPKLVGD